MPPRARLLAALASLALAAPVARASTAVFGAAGSRLTVPVRSLQELRFADLVRQTWDVSCGAAALSTLLTYHLGRPVSEYAIATWILRGVDPQRVRARGGFSLLDLKRFAEALGYRAEGYGGMTLADVADLGVPAIVPVRIHGLDHFVVVRGVLGGRVVIGDPAFGNLTVDAARFEQLWKGGIAFVVLADGAREPAADRLAPDVADLRVPDLPSVGRLLRGAGPAPLTRGQPAVP
ncbi:MAG TPA: C39 family peptidase [Gammaproteobacteria bacterium]